METHDSTHRELADRANGLYWDSEASVNDIAEDLDLSKGSLYALVRPRGSGIDCPECGVELEYPNRTAREKGYLHCPGCGLEEEEAVVRVLAEESASVPATVTESPEAWRVRWGVVLLGAAAAVLLARWTRR